MTPHVRQLVERTGSYSCSCSFLSEHLQFLNFLFPYVYVAFLEERRKGQENRGRQISERKEVKEEKGENGREEIGEIMSEEEKWKEKEERNM